MPNLRTMLLLGLFMVGFLLWNQWQIDYAPRPATRGAEPTSAPLRPEAAGADLPSPADVPDGGDVPVARPAPGAEAGAASAPDGRSPVITVTTDVLDLEISLQGGTIERAALLAYPVEPDADERVTLFTTAPDTFYVAQAGLLSDGSPAPNHTQTFSATQQRYELGDGAEELVVPLTWSQDGITVTREYVFRPGDYAITVRDRVRNQSEARWVGNAYRQIQRVPPPPPGGSTFTHPERFSFTGLAYYTPDDKYEKFKFEGLGTAPVQATAGNLWAAMVQHYFIGAWVPPEGQEATVQLAQVRGQPRYLARVFSPAFAVEPGATGSTEATLFVGPKLQDRLDDVADGLGLTVDYGIFTPFSKVLFWLLSTIHAVVGNWGWSIVLLTVLVKAAFYKLTEAQYRSMAKLRKLQPRIVALKERYGDDKQQFNMKMMEIYKTEKVNPLGGCLPVLVQIPVFIALYWVLVESVELRQAPFMLWIQDLSSPDPFFILPIINGAAMFMTTKLSPNPAADPIQQKIMLSMPIVFSVMFAFFQAGLVLYWAVNAVLSLAQQWVITKRIEAQG